MRPAEIKVLKGKKELLVIYTTSKNLILTAKYLRSKSPSAENKPHVKKKTESKYENVEIKNIEMIGNYAMRIDFSDGHTTGIYSWDYLFKIGQEGF